MQKTIYFLLLLLFCCRTASANPENAAVPPPLCQTTADPFVAAKGHFSIGTTFFSWTGPGGNYLGQIWYPTEPASALPCASYLPKSIYQTSWIHDHPFFAALQSVSTGAVLGAPPLRQGKSRPLLLYSPGLGLTAQAGTFFFEYLASRGFIVAAINHPGSSFYTEKTDGSLIPYDKTATFDDPVSKQTLTGLRASELSTALDALLKLNTTSTSLFFQTIDPTRIGVFGHSIGGRSALRAAALDKRFKAAANLDGSLENEPPYPFRNQQILMAETDIDEVIAAELAAGTTKPEEVQPIKNEYARSMTNLFKSRNNHYYLFYYKNTRHMNYTDMPLLLPANEQIGSADGTRVLLSMSSLLNDFFRNAFFAPSASLGNNYFSATQIPPRTFFRH